MSAVVQGSTVVEIKYTGADGKVYTVHIWRKMDGANLQSAVSVVSRSVTAVAAVVTEHPQEVE